MANFGSTTLWLAVFILLAVLGGLLILRGLRPRRTGDTRYCRRCRYNLRGTTGEKCTECGADLRSPDAIVTGERTVRRGRVAMGGLLVLMGLAGGGGLLFARYQSFDFYVLRPTSWVISDVFRGNAPMTARALKELRSRTIADAGTLSDQQVARVADFCLTEQARPVEIALVCDAAIEFLGALFAADRLSGDRRTRFLENLQYLEFVSRPQIALGNELPIQMRIAARSPTAGPGYTGRGIAIRIDGQTHRDHFGRWQGSGSNGSGSSSGGLENLAAGKHLIECDVELTAVARPANAGGMSIGAELPSDADSKPIHRFARTFSYEVDVLEGRALDSIQFDRSPDTDAAVRRSLQLSPFRLGHTGWLSGSIELNNATLPVAIAADVFIEYDGKSIQLKRSIVIRAGQKTARAITVRIADAPTRIALVLRSSAAAAAREVDVNNIWEGELRFENIAVEHVGGPHTSRPAADPNTPP